MIPLKVLFAEDDRLDQLAFERFVEEHGLPITYLLAGSLNEAKCLVGQEKFDVIVVDYSLGDGTAMDLLPFAAGIPVILIAGTRDEEIAARAFTAGISDSLVKDIGRNYLEQLPERIEKAVGRRLRSVETLQENQALYRRVVDTANEGILVSDETHRTTFANRRMAELLGYTPEELLGRSMEEFIFPEDLADHRQRMSNRRQGVGEQYERRLRRRDGSTLWTSVSATPILENGEFRGSIGLYTDITERKRMEEALRESEEKYRALVENANEAIIVTQDGALKFANPKASKLFGYSLQEAVGRPFVEFIHPDDRYLVAERYRKRLEGQVSTVVYPFRTIHKDGSIRWAEINSVRIAWEGRPAIMSYLSDITERKQAEEALRESEAKYRLLADNTVDGIWLLDMNFKLMYCSPASEKQSGFTLQEIMEMSLEQYFTPESLHVVAESFLEEMPKVEADPDYNPILTLDLEFYKKDGTAFWAESKFSIVRDKHGKPVSILGLARDITERKQLEKALRESEAKYRSLVETAIEGVASIDLNGNLTFINDALCRMTGYTQDELLNKPFAGLLHPDDLPALMEAFLSEVAGTRTGPIIEFRGIPKTGQSIWFSTQPTAITIDGKIIGFNAILHDITERKRVEESLRESQKQFQALTETTSDFIWEMDVNGVYTYCSPQINELWGYKPEDMIGRRPFDLMVPEDRERAIKMFRTISESPRSFKGMETSSRDNTDRIVVLETSGVPFFDIDGRLCGYRGISRDITERKRVEESLRESEESFHSLFENSTIGLYRTTPDGRILLANPELCRMLGFPTFEELARRNLEEEGFTTEYSRQAFRQEIEEKGEIRGLESAWKRRDETILFVRESVHTVRDAEGSVLYYEGTVEDITERKRAEEALRESKERLELALIGGDLDSTIGIYRPVGCIPTNGISACSAMFQAKSILAGGRTGSSRCIPTT
ncbi:MAG: PAS domain S-box protein [Coprothermobacterota bacterium]|nr:PAS domain S-box protein [Coprothermobacterota bacterium]